MARTITASVAPAIEVETATVAPVAPVRAMEVAPVALSSVVLSRSQIKALAYAEKLYAANELGELALSGNKTDAILHNAIVRREAVKKAAGNNQKIFALIQARNGSDTRFPLPASSKHADLFSWVAACHALIRGKDDSTEKAVESRARTVNERFSECFSLIEELRTLK